MACGLSRYEQEVIINFNAEDDTATLYSANPVWIRKMDKLVKQNPEQFEMYRQEKLHGEIVSKAYKFPKEFITIRTKKRDGTMSEEQRKAVAERMKRIHAERSSISNL